MENEKSLAKRFMRREWDSLNALEKRVIQTLARRSPISRVAGSGDDDRTFGQVVADKVAEFGGSWTFIGIFAVILVGWVALNSFLLVARAFDPYPYILLNLFLSMIAALQAPVIMMSQNRQSAKDREAAEHDYEVNLKAELEITTIQEKLDELREEKWAALVEMQQRQIELLERLLRERLEPTPPETKA